MDGKGYAFYKSPYCNRHADEGHRSVAVLEGQPDGLGYRNSAKRVGLGASTFRSSKPSRVLVPQGLSMPIQLHLYCTCTTIWVPTTPRARVG